MKKLILLAIAITTLSVCNGQTDKLQLQKTSEDIRLAFSKGDVDEIMRYHHPDVEKALAYDKYLKGGDAVRADLVGVLSSFKLEFVKNDVESLLILGETAIEQTQFTIKGTPKNGGESFLFSGRAQVVYVRYKKSPSGWASIREVIQPAVR
jgi:ketosteroid isomerase-like protein